MSIGWLSDSFAQERATLLLPVLLRRFCAAMLGLVLITSDGSAGWGADKSSGWRVVQEHAVNGRQVFSICPTCLRFDQLNAGFSLIADKNTVYCFNDRKKLLYQTEMKSFDYRMLDVIKVFRRDYLGVEQHWVKTKETLIGDLKTICYQCKGATNVYSVGRVGGGYLAGKKHEVLIDSSIYVSKDIELCKEFSKLVAQLEGTPDLSGLPIKEVTSDSDGGVAKPTLETKEAKRVPFSSSQWQLPASYRRTALINDVTNVDGSGVDELLGH